MVWDSDEFRGLALLGSEVLIPFASGDIPKLSLPVNDISSRFSMLMSQVLAQPMKSQPATCDVKK